MIGAGPKRKKGTGLVQNATTTTSLGEMFATVVKHRSQEVAEASAVTIEAETAEVVDIAEAVEDIVETIEVETGVEAIAEIVVMEIRMVDPHVESTKEVTIEERPKGVQESLVDGDLRTNEVLVVAEIPRGVFI